MRGVVDIEGEQSLADLLTNRLTGCIIDIDRFGTVRGEVSLEDLSANSIPLLSLKSCKLKYSGKKTYIRFRDLLVFFDSKIEVEVLGTELLLKKLL